MIIIDSLKPFYTKKSGDKLRIVFASDYLSIRKDDEIYKFVPLEGKEIVIDMKTGKAENLSSIFVFQNGNRFVRLPLYQLFLISNIGDFLEPIISGNKKVEDYTSNRGTVDKNFDSEALIKKMEYANVIRAIDFALDSRDEKLFNELCVKLKELEGFEP